MEASEISEVRICGCTPRPDVAALVEGEVEVLAARDARNLRGKGHGRRRWRLLGLLWRVRAARALLGRAAREDVPTLCDEDRVRLARRRHVHALPIERPDTGGHVAQGQVAETELPGVVPAPREDVATCAEGHNVRRRAAGPHEHKARLAKAGQQPMRSQEIGRLVRFERRAAVPDARRPRA